MLESILIVRHVIVVVIGVSKERIARSEYVTCTEIRGWQLCLMRILDSENLLSIIVKTLSQLITKVRIRIAITDNLHWINRPNGSVISCDYHLIVRLCQLLDDVCKDAMLEPAKCNGAIGTLVTG